MSELEIESLVAFCRELREHGLAITPSEVITAVHARQLTDMTDREEAFYSLRTVLTTCVEDFPVFEELFGRFWNRAQPRLMEREAPLPKDPRAPRMSPNRRASGLSLLLQNWTSSGPAAESPEKVLSASNIESVSRKDFT